MKPTQTRQPLSRDRILRAALAIVDREGLDSISMRRIGEELGVEAMSLYNHVENKAAMLDGVFELVLAEQPRPKKASGAWKTTLRDRACAFRAVLRAHPNALPLFAMRPAVTPASIAHVEGALEVLRRAGFPIDDAISAMQVLSAYVVGHTVAAFSPRKPDEESSPSYERLDEASFPRVVEAARALAAHDLEQEFELGLDALLDGLDARLARLAEKKANRRGRRV